MIGRQYAAMPLSRVSKDPDYGYSEKKPVPVAGGFGDGGKNVYRYLNALRGPESQEVHYSRVGTCCDFKTKKSPFGSGLLEVYEVAYEGAPGRRLYFNWYDSGDVLIPVGLTAKAQ